MQFQNLLPRSPICRALPIQLSSLNAPAAVSRPNGKTALDRSVRRNGCARDAIAGTCWQLTARPAGMGEGANTEPSDEELRLPAQPARMGELTKTKPSDGDARGWCRSAACFGASPLASALGLESRRDPALHSQHFTIAPLATRPKPDISTWQRLGHFYLALT